MISEAGAPEPRQTDAPLRILQVTPRYAPYVGGTEIHTGAVAAELAARGHHVTVLTTDVAGQLPKHERVDGVDICRVRAWPKGSDLYFAPRLRAIIKRPTWDLVHVQGYHTAVAPIALKAAHDAGHPTVLTFHSGGHASLVRNSLRPLHVRSIRDRILLADQLVGVSKFEAQLFADRLGIRSDRIAVIPNGVSSFESIAKDRPPLRPVSRDGDAVILSVGRLVRYKGHQRVIRALPFLIEAEPRTRLMILGEGPYERHLRREADKLGVADHVTFDFIPGTERERLHDLMRRATLAMLLSDYESHGMAAHEALGAGLPLLVANRSALGELVTAGLATAVPPTATPREIANIALRTMDRHGDDVVEAPSPPTWEEITDRIEATYRSLVPAAASQG